MALLTFLACNDTGLSGGTYDVGSDVGIDAGGAQDIGYAREIIEDGGVPSGEAFTAEGLFSEHDLPLTASGCEELLCPLAPAAWTDPVDGRGERLLLQLGFDTFVTRFERRPLRLVVALDVSGSMDDTMDGATKLDVMQAALVKMADNLGPDDQVAFVAFSEEAYTRMSLTRMDAAGVTTFVSTVKAQRTISGTSIEAGLDQAYGILDGVADPHGVEDRVILLTDAQPNIDGTGNGAFLPMVRDAAALGIGTTVMGVGLDFGSELADAIGKVRGGNAYYLDSQATVDRVMLDEFDYVVTPAAYDLSVDIRPAPGLRLEEGYGAPVDDALGSVNFGATTLFFSSGDGGMGILLAPDTTLPENGPTASFSLSYEDAETGEVVAQQLDATWTGGADFIRPADDVGVYKMAVLVDEYLALNAAADWCENTMSGAEASGEVEEARVRLGARGDELADAPLQAESTLLGKLLDNMQGGKGNCVKADSYRY